METIAKYKKFFKEDNYVHCSICGNYRNINSFGHRKSKDHQKKLAIKLRKTAFHLSQKKKKAIIIHDEQWQNKGSKRFCHFCNREYEEHSLDGEFVVENLGSLRHHADSHHAESVKVFLEDNFSKEKIKKYCIQATDLDNFLKKVADAKSKYMKKMDILHNMVLKQMKSTEYERKNFLYKELQTQPSSGPQNSLPGTSSDSERVKSLSVLNNRKNKSEVKVPPWLEDVCDNSTGKSNTSSAPVIGPTMETLVKHMVNQKKKGLPENRVGANFKRAIQRSSKWLPSFHGTWNQRRHKELKGPGAKQNNKKFKF